MADPTTPDTPLSPEIVKLTEKLAKDPQSRLFVPLAEEYLKIGMLDEAKMVLTDGLKIHPHFPSARMALGKVHFEKGEIDEARAVFEEVVAANPDNLLAQRRLARIYMDRGEPERAKNSCEAVLAANPKDPEMKSLLEEIQSTQPGPAEPAGGVQEEERTETLLETTSVSESEAASPMSAGSAGVSGKAERSTRMAPGEAQEAQADPLSVDAPPLAQPESSHSQRGGRVERDELAGPSEEQDPEITKETRSSPVAAEGDPVENGDIVTEALADLYIKQGYYDQGMEIYQKILEREPANEAVLRKVNQTRSLMDILARNEKAGSEAKSEPMTETPKTGPPVEPVQSEPQRQPDSSPESDKVRRLEAWLESIRKGQDR